MQLPDRIGEKQDAEGEGNDLGKHEFVGQQIDGQGYDHKAQYTEVGEGIILFQGEEIGDDHQGLIKGDY